ncbi:MAG: hypothetical protein MUP70_10635 [Candidatus Aminicenantes bacterium]|nr:hypothetical protein [Candidatus Aminicenantes bacterium]
MKRLIVHVTGFLCLFVCLLVAVLIFRDDLAESTGKISFLLASAGWFVFAFTAQVLKKR